MPNNQNQTFIILASSLSDTPPTTEDQANNTLSNNNGSTQTNNSSSTQTNNNSGSTDTGAIDVPPEFQGGYTFNWDDYEDVSKNPQDGGIENADPSLIRRFRWHDTKIII